MNISLSGKRILVTGAGKGIGRALAKKAVECGADVVALSRTQSDLDSLKQECSSITTVTCDLADWDGSRALLEGLGQFQGLVNNAGTGILEPFMEIKPESFDRVMNVNLKSVINVSQVVAAGMIASGKGGSIVNVSSQVSMRPLWDHTVYTASKAALDSVTLSMALELGKHQIRVNSVNPTVVMTELGRLGWSDPEKAAAMKAKIPLGRFAEVEEVVSVVLFLLSDHAAMVNAAVVPIDGGAMRC